MHLLLTSLHTFTLFSSPIIQISPMTSPSNSCFILFNHFLPFYKLCCFSASPSNLISSISRNLCQYLRTFSITFFFLFVLPSSFTHAPFAAVFGVPSLFYKITRGLFKSPSTRLPNPKFPNCFSACTFQHANSVSLIFGRSYSSPCQSTFPPLPSVPSFTPLFVLRSHLLIACCSTLFFLDFICILLPCGELTVSLTLSVHHTRFILLPPTHHLVVCYHFSLHFQSPLFPLCRIVA
jgi:hypothetical protein